LKLYTFNKTAKKYKESAKFHKEKIQNLKAPRRGLCLRLGSCPHEPKCEYFFNKNEKDTKIVSGDTNHGGGHLISMYYL
jgi:hypothetical protein